MASPSRRRGATYLLSVLIALAPVASAGGRLVTIVGTTAGLTLAVPDAAEAQRRSGGYARPRAPAVRTPSVRPAPRAIPRTPSTSQGYRRPSVSPRDGSGMRSPPSGAPSMGDRSLSRRGSGEALQRYRMDQERAPSATPSPVPSRRPSTAPPGERHGWGSGRSGGPFGGWEPPPYAFGSRPSFGVWDAVFLWFLLDTLSRPGHADFFHNHQNDPGYQQWRAEAEQRAQTNPALRAKLDQLDRELAEREGQLRDPDFLPPDTPPDAALAERDAPPPLTSPGGPILTPVLLGGGVFLLLWAWRRNAFQTLSRAGGGSSMGPLETAGNILRRKISGERYVPSLFRVGMTVTMDPTPFVLAADLTKVPVPAPSGANLLANVQAVGTLRNGATLYRLYIDERSFFQLHLDQDGMPDECRFFGWIDEVNPASAEEWGFWLDEREGMIGWPEFQTKDGKIYARAWTPGDRRIAPQRFVETRAELNGSRTVRREAMLYAAPTGAAAPAPETEYVLVEMVESEGQAWVEIHAGIDVNPAALSLS